MWKSPDLMRELTSILLEYHRDLNVFIVLSDSIIILPIVYWQHRVLATMLETQYICISDSVFANLCNTILVTKSDRVLRHVHSVLADVHAECESVLATL